MEQLYLNYPDIVNIKQVTEMLKIGKGLAYKLIQSGEIKSRKVGREYKIQKQVVLNYLNSESDK